MARNRKRAKERRARRPQPVAGRARDTTARGGLPEPLERERPAPESLEPAAPEGLEDEVPSTAQPAASEPLDYEAPSPLEHAAPDVEIAEAQLELGRLQQLDEEQGVIDEEQELEPEETGGRRGGGGVPAGGGFDGEGDGAPGGGAGELAVPGRAPVHPAASGNRLINFLQGSWRELQRVQWPDRRQVMQATGVVIGFVIVAGLFLGVSDWAAGHIVSLIENGHF